MRLLSFLCKIKNCDGPDSKHEHQWSAWAEPEKTEYHEEGLGGPHYLDRAEYKLIEYKQNRFCKDATCNLRQVHLLERSRILIRLHR